MKWNLCWRNNTAVRYCYMMMTMMMIRRRRRCRWFVMHLLQNKHQMDGEKSCKEPRISTVKSSSICLIGVLRLMLKTYIDCSIHWLRTKAFGSVSHAKLFQKFQGCGCGITSNGHCKPTSCLYHLIPSPRDTSVITRLRPTILLPKPSLRTKKYCSFINFGLHHYQPKK